MLMLNFGQVIGGQPRHLHDQVAIKTVGQHCAGNGKLAFLTAFLAAPSFAELDTFLTSFI
ncbi:hypothetical protein SSYM_0129, partial [Serratia symbiotica str. Tucson]